MALLQRLDRKGIGVAVLLLPAASPFGQQALELFTGILASPDPADASLPLLLHEDGELGYSDSEFFQIRAIDEDIVIHHPHPVIEA